MIEWISFEASIRPMEWGDSTYTVLPLPDDVYEQLRAQKAKRVEIELNDHPFNMAITKAPVIPQAFFYAGKTVLAETSIEPGDIIDVRLRKADPNMVDEPDHVALALRQADLTEVWAALTPGKRRGLLHQISSAERAEPRAARIAKLIGAPTPGQVIRSFRRA